MIVRREEMSISCSVNEIMTEWDDTLSVGVDIIDKDHQAFFKLPALMQDIKNSEEKLRGVLIETYINVLREYIDGHFLREQYALIAINFEDIKEHIDAHDYFALRVSNIVSEYRNGQIDAIDRLGQFVTNWMTNHIKTMDYKYIGVLSNSNVDDRPLSFILQEEIIFVD